MTGPQKITIECAACSARLTASENSIGRTFKCPKCGAPVTPEAPDAVGNNDSWISDTISAKEPMIVVRYAPDVVSDPMPSSEVFDHLRTGRLTADLLFAEVGSTKWKPLTFMAPTRPARKVNSNTQSLRIHRADYRGSQFTMILGVCVCLLTVVNPLAGAFGVLVVSIGWMWFTFTWVNTFFLNVQAILWKIAHSDDG